MIVLVCVFVLVVTLVPSPVAILYVPEKAEKTLNETCVCVVLSAWRMLGSVLSSRHPRSEYLLMAQVHFIYFFAFL